jgi:hypothetical protein
VGSQHAAIFHLLCRRHAMIVWSAVPTYQSTKAASFHYSLFQNQLSARIIMSEWTFFSFFCNWTIIHRRLYFQVSLDELINVFSPDALIQRCFGHKTLNSSDRLQNIEHRAEYEPFNKAFCFFFKVSNSMNTTASA